jgi:peptidyl-prolyl cis-trans isomerase A (cyclophilin A)/peptidyl-prolyl cis-trans isomerase B (cyclophilin B)
MRISAGLIATLVLGLSLAAGARAANPRVEIETNLGAITLELYADKAPRTVDNFLQYAKSGFYRDAIFHRVIPGFMAQGGGYTRTFEQKPTRAPIAIESDTGLRNLRGTIAMARTRVPDSATAQFFINVADNEALNYRSPGAPGYAVFGKVVKGMDVVDRIVAVPTGSGGPFPTDVPRQEIVIQDVKLLEVK